MFFMTEEQVSSICKALGDPNRLRIVKMLSGCEKCACVILEAFDITQPTLSHHMKILRLRAGQCPEGWQMELLFPEL